MSPFDSVCRERIEIARPGYLIISRINQPENGAQKRPENSRSFLALHLPMKNKPIGMGVYYYSKQVPTLKCHFTKADSVNKSLQINNWGNQCPNGVL